MGTTWLCRGIQALFLKVKQLCFLRCFDFFGLQVCVLDSRGGVYGSKHFFQLRGVGCS